jgi:hypothetical protein
MSQYVDLMSFLNIYLLLLLIIIFGIVYLASYTSSLLKITLKCSTAKGVRGPVKLGNIRIHDSWGT